MSESTGSAELDALIALVDAFEDEIRDEFKNGTGGYTYKARRELLLAVRECVRDAKRLNYMDKNCRSDVVDCHPHTGEPELIAEEWKIMDQCMDIRTAIDAAIASQAEGAGGEHNG